jgi:hypothetical protein
MFWLMCVFIIAVALAQATYHEYQRIFLTPNLQLNSQKGLGFATSFT